MASHAPGIRSIGVCVGETELARDELAREYNVTETALEQALGSRRVRVTRRDRIELALDAARDCLDRASLRADQLDVVIYAQSRMPDPTAHRFVNALGAPAAHGVHLLGPCNVVLTALSHAVACLAHPWVERVLVVYAEVSPPGGRSDRPVEAQNIPMLYSDGGVAAVVERGAPLRPLAFGFAENGLTGISLLDTATRLTPQVSAAVVRDITKLPALSFERCLAGVDGPLTAVDRLIFEASLPRLRGYMGRHIKLGAASSIDYDGRCHMWAGDALVILRDVEERALVEPGGRVFVSANAIGASGCGAFQT